MSAPPLPPASTLRRPPRFPTAAAAIFAGFLGIQFLNFAGFCYRDARYYSSIELIDRAILDRMERAHPPDKQYASLLEFHQLNPNCCALFAWGHYFADPIFVRFFGYYVAVAEIWYRYSDVDPQYPFYQAYVSLDACGRVLHSRGTQESSGPTPGTRRSAWPLS